MSQRRKGSKFTKKKKKTQSLPLQLSTNDQERDAVKKLMEEGQAFGLLFGSLRFPSSNRPPAKWARVNKSDLLNANGEERSPGAIERLVQSLLVGAWRLDMPSVVITLLWQF